MELRTETVVDLARQVRSGELGARELVAHSLERIEVLNPTLNAFVAVDGERAMAAAGAIDAAVAAGRDPGPLAGIPLGVKDLEDAAGFVTTRGSALFAGGPPAAEDSPQVARLVAAGCVVVGKTNTPELGHAPDTDNRVFGPTMNPWDTTRSPGGSSGGSAAASASGMVALATGSDGGGSIRIPASCCGFTGMKPSLGRVPEGGTTPPAWLQLSTRGPMALRASDIAAVFDVVVGPEVTDLSSLPRPESDWSDAVVNPKPPLSVAWSPTLGYATPDAEVLAMCEAALGVLEGLGTEIVEVGPVFERDPLDEWLTLASACNLRTLEAFRGTPEWERVDPVLAMLADGAASLSAVEVVRAADAGHRLNLALVDLFHSNRVLVTPTTASLAPPRSLKGAGMVNGSQEVNWVRYTYPFNLTRSPAASVCTGLASSGIPVGLQLVGPQHGDLVVLRTAAALEEAIGFGALAPV